MSNKVVITNDPTFNEDIDDNILHPVLTAFEVGIYKMGYKVTDDVSDAMFAKMEELLADLFPNSDYRNYN